MTKKIKSKFYIRPFGFVGKELGHLLSKKNQAFKINDNYFTYIELIEKVDTITKSKLLRDLCIELGVAMTIEDSWGGDIATSAIAHLAHSTPSKYLFSSTDFNSYNSLSYSKGAPRRKNGKFEASNKIGLGIDIDPKKINNPIFSI